MDKLSPKIKIGCSKCKGLDLEISQFTNFNFSEGRSAKVTSIIKTSSQKSSKVVSLF
jgi:hypothetical protein